jgi:hypothetical protein
MSVVRNNCRGDGGGWWLEAVVGECADECDEMLPGSLREVSKGKQLNVMSMSRSR